MIGIGVVASAIAGGAGAAPVGPTAELPRLPEAATWSDRGVAGDLAREEGAVRVRVVLRSQPLLAAASSERFKKLAQPKANPAAQAAAQRRPGQITALEKASTRKAEGSYERAVHGLDDESAQSSKEVAQVAAAIERHGGTVLDRELLPAAIVARVDSARVEKIRGLDGVHAIEAAPTERPVMDVSVQAVGAPTWWAAGFTGGSGTGDQVPADAAVQAEAPDPTHPAFAGVTVDNSPVAVVDDHGTHTAGIIASNNATYRGVAYGLDRIIGSPNTPYALGITDGNGNPGASDPAEVINRSFGGSGTDDNQDDGIDVITSVFGISRAEASGNSNVNGAPTVENLGRNIMSVAAFNDVGTVASTDDVVLGVSSRGPSPGGRKKPDLIAPGGSILAPSSFWNSPSSNPDFSGMSGTSFSTPHVAGAMTLLEGAGIGDSMAQRAILINSARDWNGTNTGLAGWTAPQTGWRPEVGWGELNLTTALAQRGNYELGEVAGGEAAFYRATVPAGAKATMAFELRGIWPNYPQNGSQPVTYTQSNLNLRQYTAAGTEIPPPAVFDPPNTTIDPGPDAVDPNDTVEQVRAPSAQTITYKVEAASTVEGAAAEPFALAAATPLQELVAPVTRPIGSVRSPTGTVACNQPVTITTALVNDSPDLNSTASAVELVLPAGVQLLSGAQTQTVSGGVLEAGSTSEQKAWTVQATTDGPKTLTVAGVGEGLGTPFRRTQSLTLEADCIAPETTIDAIPGSPTNDSTPSFDFSATGGASGFECSVDGGPFLPCSSGFSTAILADGSHTFAVRARDAAGNLDASPSTRTFTVDTIGPETTISGGPSGPTRERQPRFTLVSSEAASFECAIDDRAYGRCSSSFETAPLAGGLHTLRVRAVDAANNVDSTPAVRSFEVDRVVAGRKLRAKESRGFNGAIKVVVAASEPVRVRVAAQTKIDGRAVETKPARLRFAGGRKLVKLRPSARGASLIEGAIDRGEVLSVVAKARFTDGLGNEVLLARRIRLG